MENCFEDCISHAKLAPQLNHFGPYCQFFYSSGIVDHNMRAWVVQLSQNEVKQKPKTQK